MDAAAYLDSIRKPAAPPQRPVATPQPEKRPLSESSAAPPRPLSLDDVSLFGLVELILKDRGRLEGAIRQRGWQPLFIPRFLAISLASFVLFGAAMAIVMGASGYAVMLTPMTVVLIESQPLMTFEPADGFLKAWGTGGVSLTIAYAIGLVAATGICLPSLYFYGLLAGVKLTMVDVVVHALKAKATTAIALVGILPVYVAISMGVITFDILSDAWMRPTLMLGLCLPFVAGLWGTVSLYRGFASLADTLPQECRDQRACFLRRLVASWGACYTAVAPVMIFTIWQSLQALTSR